MKMLTVILAKAALWLPALWLVLRPPGAVATFGSILALGVILDLGSYLIGDLGLYPLVGNFVASVLDVALAAVIIYSSQTILPGFTVTWGTALFAAVIGGLVELLIIHPMLGRQLAAAGPRE